MQWTDTAGEEKVHLLFERSYTPPTHKHHNSQVDFPVPSDMLQSSAEQFSWTKLSLGGRLRLQLLISEKHQELKIKHQLGFG